MSIYATLLEQWWDVQRLIIEEKRQSRFDKTGLDEKALWIEERSSKATPETMFLRFRACNPPRAFYKLVDPEAFEIRPGTKRKMHGRLPLITFDAPQYVSGGEVQIAFSEYWGPLAAEGFLVTLQTSSGQWKVVDVKWAWIS